VTDNYTQDEIDAFLEFLDEIKLDVQSEGGDYITCLKAALGLVHRPNPSKYLPEIKPTLEGKTAVVVCFHGEEERWPGMNAMLLDPDSGEVSKGTPPNSIKNVIFRYRIAKSVRGQYRTIGYYDPYNAQCYEVLEKLKAKMPKDIMVDLGFMDCRPFIEEKVIEVANKGASKIIVVHTMITVSDHTNDIETRVEGVRLQDYGVKVVFTEPFWNDENFLKCEVNRTLEAIGEADKSKVGVVYLGYGLPAEYLSPGKLATYNIETSNRFAEAYLKELNKHGIKHTMYGWLRFNKPDIPDCAKELSAKGARLIIFNWFHTTENMHTLLDMPGLFVEAEPYLPEGTKLVKLGPEKDYPGFIDVLIKQIEKASKKFTVEQ
jgi:protoheme ferro-lyase